MTPLHLLPPVSPWRGLRTTDAFGAGGYQASRGDHVHMGLDFRADAGDLVIAPCPCSVAHVGVAYAGIDLGSIHLDGIGEFGDFRLKLLYVRPATDTIIGAVFGAGDAVGIAQSVAGYWQAQHPERGLMQNHVHEEVRINGLLVDPTFYTAFPDPVAA